MKKIYTLFYTINHFDKNEMDLLDVDDILNSGESQFSDVLQLLDKVEYSPGNRAVQNILEFSKSYSD